jgi:hypothetical protein
MLMDYNYDPIAANASRSGAASTPTAQASMVTAAVTSTSQIAIPFALKAVLQTSDHGGMFSNAIR